MNLLEADPKGIDKNIEKCAGIPYYWAMKILKKDALNNLSLLYAFYKAARDIAAIPNKLKARQLLGELEEELDAPSTTCMVRLGEVFDQYNIDKLYAKELISAARFQASRSPLAHHNQLVIYCYKNMGSLALMMAPVLGADSKAQAFALDLGIGGNLVRICSRVLEDARKGHVFLPRRELNQLKLRTRELAKQGDTPVELKKLIEKYLDLADIYLESSLDGLVYLPVKARIGVLLVARTCKETSAKIRRMDYEVLEEEKIQLNLFNKAAIIVLAFADILRPRFWRFGKRRAFLHPSLLGLPGVASEGAGAE